MATNPTESYDKMMSDYVLWSRGLRIAGPGYAAGERMGEEGSQTVQFVLVHGAGHGGWCWFKIRSLLESSGYKVTCVDLKASGIDIVDPDSVSSFQEYNYPLVRFLSSLPENEKVILVGHSAGGLSVTDAIHRFPHKLHSAIYVAANMSKHGLSTDEGSKDGEPDASKYGNVMEVKHGLGADNSPTSVIYKKEFQRQLLYQMSPPEDSTLALMLLRPVPVMAFNSARFDGGGEEADNVRRVYVKTMSDRVVSVEKQDGMIRQWPPSQVFELDSDHSPFFSVPFDLFRILIDAATSPSSAVETSVSPEKLR